MPRTHKEILAGLRERIDSLEAELDEELRAESEAETERERRESAEDVRALRQELSELREELREAREGPPPPGEEEEEETPPGEEEETPPVARTRPGRKKGGLYDWDVDEAGRVVDLDIATIYSGEDEDDEVELPADEEEAA